MKKKGIGSEARAERMANADTDMQLLNEAERGRHLQKQKKRRLQGREDEVCCDFYLFIYTFCSLFSYSHIVFFLPSKAQECS
jgi:hypothetical protein